MISDVRRELIFWDVVYSAQFSVNTQEVSDWCYQLKEEDPGIHVSNKGGWHSKLIEYNTKTTPWKSIEEETVQFCQTAIEDAGLNIAVKELYGWVNINNPGSYNNPHNHPKTDLSVVYYPKVPAGSGNLILARTDAAVYGNLYNNHPIGREFEIRPTEGHAYIFPAHLWHWVTPNQSEEDRISITFNVECG